MRFILHPSSLILHPVRRYSLLFIVVYGVMGASGLTGQALNTLMKDRLSLSPAASATFEAFARLPTYLGPLFGLLSDAVPLFGSRRRSYLVLAGVGGAAAWGGLALLQSPAYFPALLLFAAALIMLTLSTTVANALMVEAGQPRGLTGTFQSVQWGAANAASLLCTLASGYLVVSFGGGAAFGLYACFPLLMAAGAAILLRGEPESEPPPRAQLGRALRAAAVSRAQWLVALFLFAWFFSPGLGMALYYYQRDHLHFQPDFIGVLSAVFAGAGLPAAWAYARLAKRAPMGRLLAGAVLFGTLGHLAYLCMSSPATALAAYAADGFFSMFAMLAVFDLGARAAPARIEGTAFSLLNSARVAAIFLGGIVGGWLYEQVGLHTLIVLSAGFTAACILFVKQLDGVTGGATSFPNPKF